MAGCSYLVALVLMVLSGDTIPGGHSAVPVMWWSYATVLVSPVLIALVVATFVPGGQPKRARRTQGAGAGAGGVAGVLVIACPVCNPLAVPLFGASGALSFLAPERGVIAGVSIVLLVITLALRLRTTKACTLSFASGPPRALGAQGQPVESRGGVDVSGAAP